MSAHTDATGATATIELVDAGGGVRSYVIDVAERSPAGRADLVAATDGARIFFHTEVDPEVGRRGLAHLLVQQALADSISTGTVVVPVCPLFARYLADHGEDFVADGGRFRAPTADDVAMVERAVRAG